MRNNDAPSSMCSPRPRATSFSVLSFCAVRLSICSWRCFGGNGASCSSCFPAHPALFPDVCVWKLRVVSHASSFRRVPYGQWHCGVFLVFCVRVFDWLAACSSLIRGEFVFYFVSYVLPLAPSRLHRSARSNGMHQWLSCTGDSSINVFVCLYFPPLLIFLLVDYGSSSPPPLGLVSHPLRPFICFVRVNSMHFIHAYILPPPMSSLRLCLFVCLLYLLYLFAVVVLAPQEGRNLRRPLLFVSLLRRKRCHLFSFRAVIILILHPVAHTPSACTIFHRRSLDPSSLRFIVAQSPSYLPRSPSPVKLNPCRCLPPPPSVFFSFLHSLCSR